MALYHGYGVITKEHETLKPTKEMCRGCYEDCYNHSEKDGCWSFSEARVVDKEAHPDIYTAEREKYEKTLSCYHGVNK